MRAPLVGPVAWLLAHALSRHAVVAPAPLPPPATTDAATEHSPPAGARDDDDGVSITPVITTTSSVTTAAGSVDGSRESSAEPEGAASHTVVGFGADSDGAATTTAPIAACVQKKFSMRLRIAAARGDIRAVDDLIVAMRGENALAALNMANDDGLTALHCASMRGHVTVTVALLCAGADVSAEWRGRTAHALASQRDHASCVLVLVAFDAKEQQKESSSRRPQHHTCGSRPSKCLVCNHAGATVMCLPCCHYVLCPPCSDQHPAGASHCPLCRDTIRSKRLVVWSE